MRSVRFAALASIILAGGSACATPISSSADNIARLEQSRAAQPKSVAVQRALGVAYFKAGRYAEARTALDEAASMDPRDGVVALYLGLTAEAQNDLAAARSAYESYLTVGRTRAVKSQIGSRLAVIARKENELTAKRAVEQEAQLTLLPP